MIKRKNMANEKKKVDDGDETIQLKRSKLPILRIVLYMITGVLVGGIIGIIVTVPGEGSGLIVGISLIGAIIGVLFAGLYTIAMEQFRWE